MKARDIAGILEEENGWNLNTTYTLIKRCIKKGGILKKEPNYICHALVPQEEVQTINKFGGALKAAIGIPEEWLRKAAKSSVCKINIDSDSRLAMTAAIRKTFAEKPAEFDPRKYLGPARDNMEKLYKHKIINVLGSNDKL